MMKKQARPPMTHAAHRHTIHHRHHGWDHSFTPVARISPGESLEFDVADASGGQLTETSTVADVGRMDFGKINPVTGPVYIDGAGPQTFPASASLPRTSRYQRCMCGTTTQRP